MTWDPVHGGRTAFRACMAAVCHPGSAHPLPLAGVAADPALDAAAAVLLALLDVDVTVAAAGPPTVGDLLHELQGRTGARGGEVADADFVLAAAGHRVAAQARRGTPIAPEQGATIVYVVDGTSSTPVLLDGPGLARPTLVELPLAGDELRALCDANRHGPVGVDVFLAGADGVWALPRSTCLKELTA